ncbi:MAG: hypothetical protein OEZ06_23180 [Myxococcales bacterium]|nr:hypothetical protein [Myxococcales bacterium]
MTSPTPPEAPLSPDEARTLFSEALDGELSPERRRAFDALLSRAPELAAEFEAFSRTVGMTRRVVGAAPTPDLLPGIQRKLRQRSRGRYYGNSLAQRLGLGLIHPVALALLMLALLGLAFVTLYAFDAVSLP